MNDEKLNKKIRVEEPIVQKKEKKKGNMFLGFLIVMIIAGAIGYGLYYVYVNYVPENSIIKQIISTTKTNVIEY